MGASDSSFMVVTGVFRKAVFCIFCHRFWGVLSKIGFHKDFLNYLQLRFELVYEGIDTVGSLLAQGFLQF